MCRDHNTGEEPNVPPKYRDYLNSQEWAKTKLRYQDSGLPQGCYVCGAKRVDLHHRTYKRLGHENLRDLIPLCRRHHEEAHDLVKAGQATLWVAHKRVKQRITRTVAEYGGRAREGGWTVTTITRGRRRRKRGKA